MTKYIAIIVLALLLNGGAALAQLSGGLSLFNPVAPPPGASKFLINTGSVLLINTGNALLIQ